MFPQSGTISVLLFFFISGYLISGLLSQTYSGRPREFIVNRVLRIYPAYYAAVFIGLVTVLLLPSLARAMNPGLHLDNSPSEILATLFIFGLSGMRLVPPAWSLNTELCWYIILFVLSFFSIRSRLCAYSAFLVLPFVFIIEHTNFYGSVLGSGFAFALGAIRHELKSLLDNIPPFVGWPFLIATMLMAFVAPLLLHTTGTDEPLLLASPYVFFFSFSTLLAANKPSGVVSWLGYYGGMLSYPIFLLHWHASVFVLYAGLPSDTFRHWAACVMLTLILSALVVVTVEMPLRRTRTLIRGWSRRGLPAQSDGF